jgi:hypothetical protein
MAEFQYFGTSVSGGENSFHLYGFHIDAIFGLTSD